MENDGYREECSSLTLERLRFNSSATAKPPQLILLTAICFTVIYFPLIPITLWIDPFIEAPHENLTWFLTCLCIIVLGPLVEIGLIIASTIEGLHMARVHNDRYYRFKMYRGQVVILTLLVVGFILTIGTIYLKEQWGLGH